jgi:hypothetical protein
LVSAAIASGEARTTRKARDPRVVVEASSDICGCGAAVVASAMLAVRRLLFKK